MGVMQFCVVPSVHCMRSQKSGEKTLPLLVSQIPNSYLGPLLSLGVPLAARRDAALQKKKTPKEDRENWRKLSQIDSKLNQPADPSTSCWRCSCRTGNGKEKNGGSRGGSATQGFQKINDAQSHLVEHAINNVVVPDGVQHRALAKELDVNGVATLIRSEANMQRLVDVAF